MTQMLQEIKVWPCMDPLFYMGNSTLVWGQGPDQGSPSFGEQIGIEDREQRKQCWFFWKQLWVTKREVLVPGAREEALRPNKISQGLRTRRQTCPAS